jgi:hypothetical protein
LRLGGGCRIGVTLRVKDGAEQMHLGVVLMHRPAQGLIVDGLRAGGVGKTEQPGV